ncbi:hypothetical protein ACFO4E_18055 [Nocardiopsis mangrovi]|uniref:Uncharacterized protein n=1 Tax=Nocardiopsis mangrovi TaxID=1179818 RepID=A0ABV9DYD8_9ACTN
MTSLTELTTSDRIRAGALEQVLVEVPYNSAAQFHEYFGGGALPPRLGASCAFQSFEVGRLVADAGGAPAHFLADGRHVAAVYFEGAGETRITVLDPYLLHRVPLLLDRADAVDGVVRVVADAFPLRVRADGSPAPSRVRATWWPDRDEIVLEYVRFSPRRGHNAVSRAFTLRRDSALGTVPPPAEEVRPLLTHPEQNNVSIRVVHPGDLRLREVVFPLTGRPGAAAPSAGGLLTKDDQGVVSRPGAPGFDTDLALVAEAVGEAPSGVVDMLLDAAAIHARVAPADGPAMPEYAAVDE